MTEFDYCINFLESFIICFFSYRYFSLNTKQLIVSNVIIFLEITLGNLFLSSSFLPIFFVLITMIFLLKNFGLKINIELIIANVSIMLIDMISNITSLSLVTLLNMNFSFFNSSNSVLLVATALSKLLFFIGAYLFLKLKLDITNKLDAKRWTSIIVLFTLILLESAILIQNLVLNHIDKIDILVCILLMGIISILTWNMYEKILLENEEKMRVTLKNEEMKYKKENYKTLSKMSEEIYQLDHNMRYLLMMLRYAIIEENYDESINLIDEYVKKFDKFRILINTNNPYFDFLINQKLNTILKSQIDVCTTISISKSNYYFDKKYVEYILLLLDIYMKIAKKITVSIQEIGNDNLINITVAKKNNESVIFDEKFFELVKILQARYTINQIDDLVVFKSIQSMSKNEIVE